MMKGNLNLGDEMGKNLMLKDSKNSSELEIIFLYLFLGWNFHFLTLTSILGIFMPLYI